MSAEVPSCYPPALSSNTPRGGWLDGRRDHQQEGDDDHAPLDFKSEVVPLMYRVDEAAAALRLSRSSVYELIRSASSGRSSRADVGWFRSPRSRSMSPRWEVRRDSSS